MGNILDFLADIEPVSRDDFSSLAASVYFDTERELWRHRPVQIREVLGLPEGSDRISMGWLTLPVAESLEAFNVPVFRMLRVCQLRERIEEV